MSKQRADKPKVTDEIWDDDRIRGFLDKQPMGTEADVDFSVLLFAYRSMRPEDFQRFLGLFVAAGRDLNARSNAGVTLMDIVSEHRHGKRFGEALLAAGAADALAG